MLLSCHYVFLCVHGESLFPRQIVWPSLSLLSLFTNQIWRVTETHGCPWREVMLRNELSDTQAFVAVGNCEEKRGWLLVPVILSHLLSFVQEV